MNQLLTLKEINQSVETEGSKNVSFYFSTQDGKKVNVKLQVFSDNEIFLNINDKIFIKKIEIL